MAKDLRPVEFIVPRGSLEEHTIAIVKADILRDHAVLMTEPGFLSALKQAVTDWMSNTVDGISAWNRSLQDFNVGDLHQYLEDKALKTCLIRRGITGLEIDTHVSIMPSHDWSFDTVLVNEGDLPGA